MRRKTRSIHEHGCITLIIHKLAQEDPLAQLKGNDMASTPGTKKTTTKKPVTTTAAASPEIDTMEVDAKPASPNTAEAKSRFNAALDEAKAGASALGREAKERAGVYRDEAKTRGEDWKTDAKTKSRDIAVEGKAKASEGLRGLSRVIDENASTIDEKLGVKYGDYARSASRSITETAGKLDEKSVDDLAEDTREAIRKSPATAVGIAAVVGFMFARLFRR